MANTTNIVKIETIDLTKKGKPYIMLSTNKDHRLFGKVSQVGFIKTPELADTALIGQEVELTDSEFAEVRWLS